MEPERRTWHILMRAYSLGWDVALAGLAILAAWVYDGFVAHRGSVFVLGVAFALWLAARIGLTLGWMVVSALLGASRRGGRPPRG